ncbi:MAG: aldo/keto reductase, partial [Pseudomonadota bacterium]|nr:aldo/keto reductase [Pseudomonadota bacterium]
VYGDGDNERSIGRFLQRHSDVTVATKLGRAGIYPDNYTRESLRSATQRSLERLGVTQLALTQLHCVPPAVLARGEVFDWLRELREEGLIARFGASVESVDEGLLCLAQEGLSSLQVIFNIFRQKPLDVLFPAALQKQVGIIVRLPLASGLLTGKLNRVSTFRPDDHRSFNRDGAQFNVGETFAGIDYERGVALSEQIATLVPPDMTMAQMALRWILDQPAVSVIIPGASSVAQMRANAATPEVPLSPALHTTLTELYRQQIHQLVRGPY